MSIPFLFTNVIRINLFVIMLFEVFQHNILVAIGAFCALILSFLPAYAVKDYHQTLPRVVEFLVTLALLLHVLGLTFNFYHDINYWWWDQMTHFFGTAVVALLAFEFIFTLSYTGKIKMSRFLMGVFTFCVAMTIGALWEIAELYFDEVFDTHSLGDLYDTLQDLQFNTVGGLLVAVWGAWYQGRFEKRQCENDIKTGELKLDTCQK